MKICYLGNYNPDYARHIIILKGLKKNNIDVFECQFKKKNWQKYIEIFRLMKKARKADIIYIAYSDLRFVWFVRLLTKKPIFWDAFYSLYDNWVFDRRLVRPSSIKAYYFWFLDWLCSISANIVVLDTKANCDYFVKTFHLNPSKMLRVFIGADNEQLVPVEQKKTIDKFIVEFHGNYIPVQGVEHIVRAAKKLEKENILFKMIGNGQTYGQAVKLAKKLKLSNIDFINSVPFLKIAGYLAEADVSLGLLGTVDRARRAIPNKVYEASAMKRASINICSKAIDELYKDGKNILTVKAGDVDDLVRKIIWAKEHQEELKKIEENAYNLFLEYVTPEKIVKPIIATSKRLYNLE